MRPEQLVEEFLYGFARNHRAINVGRVKLRLIQRISPALADRISRNN